MKKYEIVSYGQFRLLKSISLEYGNTYDPDRI